jgi:YHS domain-containing protein
MRNMLLLCIILALVLSLGCGKKEETAQTEKTESVQQEKPKVVARAPLPERHDFDEKFPLIDPVTKEKLTSEETPYTYVYKKRIYFFKTEENLKIFKENPEKYIAELK